MRVQYNSDNLYATENLIKRKYTKGNLSSFTLLKKEKERSLLNFNYILTL